MNQCSYRNSLESCCNIFLREYCNAQLVCVLAGPAQVPMMSPNGSVPPIYVPPGYVQQVSLNACLFGFFTCQIWRFPPLCFFVVIVSACYLHSLFLCVICPKIIEENGVRRVLVLPQAEFHPGGHSPLHHPPPPPTHPHLQAFIPHPHPILSHPPPHLYSGMAGGTGDMNAQYISQYHPAHIYPDQGECMCIHTH